MAGKTNVSPFRLFRRGKIWHVRFSFRAPSGRRIQLRESTFTTDKSAAERYAVRRFGELERKTRAQETGELEEYTLDKAFGRYMAESRQSDNSTAEYRLKNLYSFFGNIKLSNITPDLLSRYVCERAAKVKASTVNRELNDLSAVLNRARNKWGVKTPKLSPLEFRLKTQDAEIKFIRSPEVFQAIENAAPEHLKPIIYTAVFTGLRKNNILNLKWSDIDFENDVITVKVKDRNFDGGRTFSVPVIPALKSILMSLPRVSEYVFTYRGRPIGSIKTAWRAIFKRTGLPYIRFHDLRHTAATWILKRTGNLNLTKEILGHRNIATTLKYAHVLDEDKRKALEDAFEDISNK